MRPPIAKRLDSQPTPIDSRTEALEEKKRLAQHLHEQGVNPLRWTEAHPAPQSDQTTLQETGLKPKDNQFEVAGKLYNWSPAVSATPGQAKAITDAYIAERSGKDDSAASAPKVEDLVDIAQVPLKHPFGAPHTKRPANDMNAAEEHAALLRHYAPSGIDPDKAHLGDPLPMKDQERLKAQIDKTLPGDASEISGLPIFYQGFDDGWIYQANEYTRPSGDLEKSNPKLAANENEHQNKVVIDSDTNEYGVIQDDTSIPKPHNVQSKYVAAVQSLPEIVSLIETLQADKPLTARQDGIKTNLSRILSKAGVEFDYTLSNPDELRSVYEQARAELSSMQGGKSDSSDLAMAMLTLQATQAIAGGSFDTVRMMQSESLGKTFLLAAQKYLPITRRAIEPLITAYNVEQAKEGPIDYQAAFDEIGGLLSDIGIIDHHDDTATDMQTEGETYGDAQETMNASTFLDRLPAFDEVTIQIGDVVLKQHPLTTATDQIFLEEFVDVASSRGCEPDPEPTKENRTKKAIHGGDDAQRRITDMDQRGHTGSGQPDGDITMSGHGNKGGIFLNTVSTHSDGIRLLAREIESAKNILRVMIKQLGASPDELDKLVNPVKARGHLFLYRKKWGWSLDKIREDLRAKIQKAFDQYYQDCLPKGPPEIVDLDGIGN